MSRETMRQAETLRPLARARATRVDVLVEGTLDKIERNLRAALAELDDARGESPTDNRRVGAARYLVEYVLLSVLEIRSGK